MKDTNFFWPTKKKSKQIQSKIVRVVSSKKNKNISTVSRKR